MRAALCERATLINKPPHAQLARVDSLIKIKSEAKPWRGCSDAGLGANGQYWHALNLQATSPFVAMNSLY